MTNFCERFHGIPISIMSCTILHPAFVQLNHLQQAEKRTVHDFIVQEMISMSKNTPRSSPSSTENDDIIDVSSPVNADTMINDLLGGLRPDDGDDGSDLESTGDEASLKLDCVNELKSYVQIAKRTALYRDKCPRMWWKANQGPFKLLAPVARKWLGCLCSSVSSERAFSTSGNTVTNKRASLSDNMVQDIVFLHDNRKELSKINF